MYKRQALDPRDRLTRVADKLSRCAWAQGKDLWLDGFTDFTPQQGEVLRQLMTQAEHMTITLTCDHLEEDDGGEGIFSPARKTAAALLRLAKKERIPCEVEHLVNDCAGKNPALKNLEVCLFGPEPKEPLEACLLYTSKRSPEHGRGKEKGVVVYGQSGCHPEVYQAGPYL